MLSNSAEFEPCLNKCYGLQKVGEALRAKALTNVRGRQEVLAGEAGGAVASARGQPNVAGQPQDGESAMVVCCSTAVVLFDIQQWPIKYWHMEASCVLS